MYALARDSDIRMAPFMTGIYAKCVERKKRYIIYENRNQTMEPRTELSIFCSFQVAFTLK